MKRKAAGFSLIEVLVAIALIALVSAVAIPSFTYVFRTSTESFSRQLANLLRECRDRALLKDMIIRVRFDLGEQKYWVEEGPSSILLPPELSDREAKDKERGKEKDSDKKKSNSDGFALVRDLTKDKKEVPNGLRITEIISPRVKKPIAEGNADVYYFPNGTAEAAIIKIEDQDHGKQNLIVHPITGNAKLVPGELEAPR